MFFAYRQARVTGNEHLQICGEGNQRPGGAQFPSWIDPQSLTAQRFHRVQGRQVIAWLPNECSI
jgi:hypothetical protein